MKLKLPIGFKVIILFLIIAISSSICYASKKQESKFIAEIDSSLQYLLQIQKDIKSIHPFLNTFHPIAVVKNSHFYIFDFDSLSRKYHYVKKDTTPFPIPKGIKASFPLSCYNSKPSCIVTKDIFDSKNGFVTIFHEFIHCSQFIICEQKLKQNLKIAREAANRNDYSWEINHPFPYQDSLFVLYYTKFLEALTHKHDEAVLKYRKKLKQHLDHIDFEYMTWQEWKEGFARFIENRIQSNLGIAENHNGEQKPYNRVTFYYGGAKFINYLIQKEPDLHTDIELLFNRMLNY